MAIQAAAATKAGKTNASKPNPLIAKLKAKAAFTASKSILKTLQGKEGFNLEAKNSLAEHYYEATGKNLAEALSEKYDNSKPALEQVESFSQKIASSMDIRESDVASRLQLSAKRLTAMSFAENGRRASKAKKMTFMRPGANV